MQLLVIGPAFGLPSIDAECIAAIALLSLRFGRDRNQWTVSACPSIAEDLPLLIDNGIRLAGFQSISRHLAKRKQPTRHEQTQEAHSIAITALLQSRASLLISAYLYVSSENYHGATRGAFSPILSPFARLLLPSSIRSAARESTAHLGLSTKEIESPHEDRRLDGVDSSFEAASKHRASLILPSKTSVQHLLADKAKGSETFRLHALADALFAPLQEMLADNTWLSTEKQPGSVDCLAYGFLSIMREAVMPNDWLRVILNERYPTLAAYTSRLKDHLGFQTEVTETQTSRPTNGLIFNHTNADALPWEPLRSSPAIHSAWLSQLLQTVLPSLQSPAIVPQSGSSSANNSLGLLSTLGACAVSAICGGLVVLKQLYHTKHGQHVQIFGQQPQSRLDHLSKALAGFGGGYIHSPNVDMLDISPSSVEHPLTEASVEI